MPPACACGASAHFSLSILRSGAGAGKWVPCEGVYCFACAEEAAARVAATGGVAEPPTQTPTPCAVRIVRMRGQRPRGNLPPATFKGGFQTVEQLYSCGGVPCAVGQEAHDLMLQCVTTGSSDDAGLEMRVQSACGCVVRLTYRGLRW